MATILLSAAGAAIGSSVGGTVAGLSTAVIGRAVGATIGKVIDQKLIGKGSAAVEHGKIDRFRLTNASEGDAITKIFGRMRVGGQVIWASDFREIATVSGGGGGKGTQRQSKTTTTTYSYSVNLAVAICEGVIQRIGRVWADGEEIAIRDLNMRVHTGTADQLPDSLMEAIEGAGQVPAYRGTAYVVLEDLQLERFGNRVPQFSFEVLRSEQGDAPAETDLTRAVKAVSVIPGTGEYALATTPVHYSKGAGSHWSANINTPSGIPDMVASLDALEAELPNVGAASLVVSWFGGDLRCQHCRIMPKVETTTADGANMPWSVAGLSRAAAQVVPRKDDRPIYGGTPSDQSVIEAIRAMAAKGMEVVFYPFILMDQQATDALPDPWTDGVQAQLPWRGRISLDKAPGQPGSSDGTAAAAAEVDAFFGSVRATDFTVSGQTVQYHGPQEWTFSRFILHYAALCKAAGGVGGFCIGSELRGLTQIRGAGNSFPFVSKLRQLVADVRAILGAGAKLGYAADWTEYFGYQPQDGSGDRFFHLDPLWADPQVDFVGIDNYMPVSDWRDGDAHADAAAGSIYSLDYLRANIEGGEGYDWYYASPEDAAEQTRTAITDGAHGEPWIWRYKDIRNWWSQPHHERIGGVRQAVPTGWVPQSKPIWFTELGCAAVDKGTNQPNKFLDQHSSESSLPKFSNGARDDLIQMQYLRAMFSHWADTQNNPVSGVYGGPMVDMSRAFVWAWDTRPYPFFPNNRALWSDGASFARGHWINGRISARPLSSVIREICESAGVTEVDVQNVHGLVRGFEVARIGTARAALQPLLLRYGVDAIERDGVLRFVNRDGRAPVEIPRDDLVNADDIDGIIEQERESDIDATGRVRLQFVQADGDFAAMAEEAVLPDETTHTIATTELPLSLTRGEGRQTAERWLAEARVARDGVRFALPPSRLDIGAGDMVRLQPDSVGAAALYRVDRVEQGVHQIVDAVRVEPSVYRAADIEEDGAAVKPFVAPVPVTSLFMDLPLITGDEVPHAPYVIASAREWPGDVAVYSAALDQNYALNTVISARTVVGLTKTALHRAAHGIWDNGAALEVELITGALESLPGEAVLAGGNLAAIGDGSPDNWEIFQFERAELSGTSTYRLSKRLRGQFGSDALMPDVWPAGSWFVRLDGAQTQAQLSANLRGISQHYRIGPGSRSYDDATYSHAVHAFSGNGLRPYAPAHLRGRMNDAGDLALTWVRRTRIEGDLWGDAEVPLGEETEAYRVRVLQGGNVIRVAEISTPNWTYPQTQQAGDGTDGATVDIEVAQLSARYGAGLPARTRIQL